MEKLALSHRAYHRVLKVARTIADLAGSDRLEDRHLLEALNLRIGQ
jgi:magnesium chelatase family protein